MPQTRISPMTMDDYASAMALWTTTPGIGLSAADEANTMRAYLLRNPGMSQGAWSGDTLIGTVLAGHDGRRGYLHHLCVRDDFRGQGIGRLLITRSLEALQAHGLEKAHAFLFSDNETGRKFWERIGWTWRTDIGVVSVNMEEARK
jgi:N-acetylglutamate synthase